MLRLIFVLMRFTKRIFNIKLNIWIFHRNRKKKKKTNVYTRFAAAFYLRKKY